MASLVVVISLLVAWTTMLNADAIIHPALISASRTLAKKGDSVNLKCSISDDKISEYPQNMYLCKDGVGIRMQMLIEEKFTSFAVNNFTSMDSGEYTCVYSTTKMQPKDMNTTGKELVVIKLHEVHPATISGENTELTVGDILQLQCQITEREYREHLVFHLYKNGVGIPETPERNSNTHAVFMIRNITTRDSGIYSCLVVEENLPMEVRGEGVNSIHIKVFSAEDLNVGNCGQDLCHPARISPDKTAVLKGDPLQIICSFENPAHKSSEFNMYLCKDGQRIQISEGVRMSVINFTVETPSSDVSGSYSCVYSIVNLVNQQCHSKPAADSVDIKVFDPDGSGSSGIIAAVTVIFLMVLAALLGYQHRGRLKHLIWSDRGRQRQGGTQDHIPAGVTEQQHQSMAAHQEMAEYATIPDLQGQTSAATVSSAIDTVYSMVQNQDQVAEALAYGKVNKKRKMKKPKGVTDVYSLVGQL